MHPHCAVKPNIKLGCVQGEGTGMWPCGGHLFSAVLSLPVCWGDFKRKLRAALMMGWFPFSTARAFISAGSLQGCPTTLAEETGHAAPPMAVGLDFTACNLSILGSLPSSLSLVDQPPLAFSSYIVFLTNKNVNWRAFSLFKHSKKVYLAGTTALVCKLIFFFPLPSFLLCCTYSGSVEEGQGILYFRISSADFEKLSLNIL